MQRDEEQFPPVPSQAFSTLGPLQVLQEELGGDFGSIDFKKRLISMQEGMSLPAQWVTYWHEVVHLALFDAGVKLTEKQEEHVCDAMGSYLAAMVAAGKLKVTP